MSWSISREVNPRWSFQIPFQNSTAESLPDLSVSKDVKISSSDDVEAVSYALIFSIISSPHFYIDEVPLSKIVFEPNWLCVFNVVDPLYCTPSKWDQNTSIPISSFPFDICFQYFTKSCSVNLLLLNDLNPLQNSVSLIFFPGLSLPLSD